MSHVTIHRKERPAITGRHSKYEFFHQLKVGQSATVSTAGMTKQESWRTLRSLRSICTYHRQAYGRQFKASPSSDGILVDRLA